MRAELQHGETYEVSGCEAEDYSGHQCNVEKSLHHNRTSAIRNRTECSDQGTLRYSWQLK